MHTLQPRGPRVSVTVIVAKDFQADAFHAGPLVDTTLAREAIVLALCEASPFAGRVAA